MLRAGRRDLVAALALGAACVAAPAQERAEPAPAPVSDAVREPAPRAEGDPVRPPGAAPPPADPARLPPVQIRGERSPTEQRRTSTAARIIIGRDEIEQFGDSTLGEVIRRLPGVTIGGRPGRGGELRMRGMGSGYTQILIDGQRLPPGFSIDQLSPESVERIELMRAPTAETGTRAVAGTINIVLREPLRTTSHDLRVGLQSERGLISPGGSWVHNGTFSDRGTYNLTLNAGAPRQRTDTIARTTIVDGVASPLDDPMGGVVTLDHEGTERSASSRRSLFFSPRLQWRLGPGEQIGLQPFVVRNVSRSVSEGMLDAIGGTQPPPYETRAGNGQSAQTVARMNLNGTHRLGPLTRAEWRGGVGEFRLNGRSAQDQFDGAGVTTLEQRSATSIRDRSWTAFGKLTQSWTPGGDAADANAGAGAAAAGPDPHSLVVGWEVEQVRRDEVSPTVVNGVPVAGGVGDELSASSQRIALFVQDEWDPAADWSAYLGLRGEMIRTRGDAPGSAVGRVDNRSQVVSPLAQLVWRFAAPRRDQLRLAVTHSYRAPTMANLTAAPSLNPLYPAPGGNVASSPDRAGNPQLRPERANGIDLAFERYLDAGGVLSVNLFWRRLRDVIRSTTELETVPWAGVDRWVARPRNLGDATSRGVEFDARMRLTDLLPGAPAVNLRANLSLFDSSVDSVPGPDNRIDQQPRATGNLGVDHRLRGTAWSVGGTWAVTPAWRTRLADDQSQWTGARRVLDAYVLWQVDSTTRLRLSVSNLVPRDSESWARIVDSAQTQTVRTIGRTDTVLGLRLEARL